MFIRRLKPSPVLAVAVGALVVGLAAPAAAQQAAHLINGKSIKNHTIVGKKLKHNTLTGKQIKESKLGKVPKAANADTLGGLASSAFAKSGLPMIAGWRTVSARSSTVRRERSPLRSMTAQVRQSTVASRSSWMVLP
jgi:hypothetical protein